MQTLSLFSWGITGFVIILARYVLLAGLASWWLDGRPAAADAGAGPAARRRPSAESVRDDIRLSVQSAAVFAVATAGLLHLRSLGLTRLYSQPGEYGWWYLGVSYLLVLILQDVFFYATHRLCHHPALFARMHRGHHRSGQPTPWTSFAFDPPEAALQALFLVLIVVTLPLHLITLLAVLTTMTLWAIVTHLGVSPLPAWVPHPWLGRWLIGPAHHGIHHRRTDRHFGLYFTFWDWLLRTQDPLTAKTPRKPGA
ncbi:MAG: sterol desaturase family protein [Cyanobacteriota bacterium]